MTDPLLVLPVSKVGHETDLFRCPPHQCTLSARACLMRQAAVLVDRLRIELSMCRECQTGRQIEKQTRIKIESLTVDAREAKRLVSERSRRGGNKGGRAKAAAVRWCNPGGEA